MISTTNKRKVAAQLSGHSFQAVWFWIKACDVINPHEDAVAVGIECEVLPFFDDVVVQYPEKHTSSHGTPLDYDCYQTKLPAHFGEAIDLVDLLTPGTIDKTKASLFERLGGAFRKSLEIGIDARFTLVMPIQVTGDLAKLLYTRKHQIDLDKLFSDSAPRRIKHWISSAKDQTGVKENASFRNLLSSFRIIPNQTLYYSKVILNGKLQVVNLKPVPLELEGNIYEAIAQGMISEHPPQLYERDELLNISEKHDRRLPVNRDNVDAAIRTWKDGTSDYEERFGAGLLDLTELFTNGRELSSKSWLGVSQQIEHFRNSLAKPERIIDLYLDCSFSVAILAGSLFIPKANATSNILQRGESGICAWNQSVQTAKEYPQLICEDENADNTAKHDHVVLAISITHNVLADVQEYAKHQLTGNIETLHLFLPSGIGSIAIIDGYHANMLANQVRQILKSKLRDSNCQIHLFMAAPIAMAFFLGRALLGMKDVAVYEFGFNKDEKYSEGLKFIDGEIVSKEIK